LPESKERLVAKREKRAAQCGEDLQLIIAGHSIAAMALRSAMTSSRS
jgi:hypothetical protein